MKGTDRMKRRKGGGGVRGGEIRCRMARGKRREFGETRQMEKDWREGETREGYERNKEKARRETEGRSAARERNTYTGKGEDVGDERRER